MNECNSNQEQQNQKYRKQLQRFSLEFKQGDLREFYHLLFEKYSQKLFNTAMTFKLLILISFIVGQFIVLQDLYIQILCIICLFLLITLWITGYRLKHQIPTAFRISHVLISMLMYIFILQINAKLEEDIIKKAKSQNALKNTYQFEYSRQASFYSMLFSLYQIVYIQIEIKWFFRVFHFLFIITINWFILGIDQLAIFNGIFYFIFIVILFYQLEISKKEDSFQMYRVIEDFQSLKSLINDILPMQIFIVQRNCQSQQQRSSHINNNNQDSQISQIPNNINQEQALEEVYIKKEIKTNISKKSLTDKESLHINGNSTAVNSNKQDNLVVVQNMLNQQKRKESSQSMRIKALSNPKQQEFQNLTMNLMNNNKGIEQAQKSPIMRSSYQSDKINIQRIKNINIDELSKRIQKQNNFTLQTQENEDNNFTENLATNPPLISKNDEINAQNSIYHQSQINRDPNPIQQQQNQFNPLKIAFANKLVLQDFQTSTFEDILKQLTKIQVPLVNKNNYSNYNESSRVNRKVNTESLQETLLSKLYRVGPIKLNQINPNSSIVNNNGQPSQISASKSLYNQNNNLIPQNIAQKGNASNRKSPANNMNEIQVNFTEELETQKNYKKQEQINLNNNSNSNQGRDLQQVLQIKSNFLSANNNFSNFGLQNGSELEYNGRIIAISERGMHLNQPNINTNQINQWNSINRLGYQIGLNQGNESAHHMHNDSAMLNQSNMQLQGQHLNQNQQNIQQTLISQSNQNNDSLNMYNYIPNNKINKVWEYLNCFLKRNNNNLASSNQRRNNLNNNNSDNISQQQQQLSNSQQQEEDKNYDIKLVECKWEGEESIMVIMNNINERLMRERLLQIEQYKDTMIDTISHNLKTPLNCILAPLESIKLILQEEKESEEISFINNQMIKNKKMSLSRIHLSETNNSEKRNDFNSEQIALQSKELLELTSIIKNKKNQSEEIQKQVSMAINNCQLLLYMINDMIDYSEIIKGENQFNLNIDYFKLSYVINTLNNLFQDQMQSKKIEFKITSKIDLSESKLLHDQRRLLQILVNLISNSLKFTFKGKIELIIDTPQDENHLNLGSIQIFQNNQPSTGRFSNSPLSNRNRQLDTRSLQSNVLLKHCNNQNIIQSNNNLIEKLADKKKLFKKERHIRFTVVDSGIGMSHQKLQKLKRMLFKKEIFNIQNSSGLGLTMCYSLIKQLGCQHTHLEILSEENVGTKFSFTIQQFYKTQQQLALSLNTKSKFQSSSPQQKQSNFAMSQINSNLGFQKFQLNNLEIKEESIQTKISPLIYQKSKKINIFQDGSSNQITSSISQQILKSQQQYGVAKSPIYNFSNLHTKTTLENPNVIQKTLNTISNDEHILDMSTEEIQGINEINKVKVNNQTHSTKLNQKENINKKIVSPQNNQKEIQKDYLTAINTVPNQNTNNSPTGNSINQELSNNQNLKNISMQKQNSLLANMNISSASKNTKSQKNFLGVQSLNQFSIASIGLKQDAQQKSRINLKESNSNYSNINQRYTMIFGKSIKSEGNENNQQDYDNYSGEDSIKDKVNSSSSSDEQNYQKFNSSFKNQNSIIQQGKINMLNERVSYNLPDQDFVDVINEKSLVNKEIQDNEICLEVPRSQADDLESKQSKFTLQRKAFLTFGQFDFNQKIGSANQIMGQSFTIQKDKSKQQQDLQSQQYQSSQEGEYSEPISENVDKIYTVQQYNFQAISKIKECTPQHFTIDNVIENKNSSQTALFLDHQDNILSDQDLSNSNMLPNLHTEQSILQTLEMILESKHVLVVDDTIYNIISLKIFFRNVQNLCIEEAYNGRDALQKYQENAINGIFYDYIFMDIEMPIMDGLECIKHIREFETANSLKKSIIITVTAYEREQQEVILAGANALIAKPIQKDKFLQTLRILQQPIQQL